MTEETEKIYFQSDGGAWMKKGIDKMVQLRVHWKNGGRYTQVKLYYPF
ncbi:MAG: hypothetical protein HFH68_08405 [Lachnospiraceae bacterium]|nr:hypothetical protein [Lachnospiraceae bacterium]